MIDIIAEITAIHRKVGSAQLPAGQARKVSLHRRYDAPIEDVWDAITNPERIRRWFLPVTGDLRLGGTFQLQGNAGGEILRCEPPRLLAVTWVMGEQKTETNTSEVEVRLSPSDEGGTVLELDHTAIVPPDFWATYGPGAVGVGWDGALLGLALYVRTGEAVSDPEGWSMSPEGRAFMTESSAAWRAAHEACGASPQEAAAAAENTRKFYVPDLDSDQASKD